MGYLAAVRGGIEIEDGNLLHAVFALKGHQPVLEQRHSFQLPTSPVVANNKQTKTQSETPLNHGETRRGVQVHIPLGPGPVCDEVKWKGEGDVRARCRGEE